MTMLLCRGQCVATFCCAVVLIYAWPLLSTRNSGDWDFVYIWDDRTNFLDNRVLRDPLSLETLYAMFTMVRLNVYEPLGWVLKFAVVKAVGMDAWWIRLVSLVVHFAAGLVLAKVSAVVLDIDYLLSELKGPGSRKGLELQRRRKRETLHFHACCMGAVVFMAHPIHVEVVGWPSAQPYSLAALFSNGALLVHARKIYYNMEQRIGGGNGEGLAGGSGAMVRVLIEGSTTSTLISTALYLGALLSKSASLMLPTAFILIDAWVFLNLSPKKNQLDAGEVLLYAVRRSPSVAIMIAFVSITAISNSEGSVPDVVSLSLADRVLKALAAPIRLLRCLFWPSNLRPHYQIHPEDLHIMNPECILPVLVTLVVLVSAFWKLWNRAASKHVLVLVFFGCMLLPVSGLIRHGIVTGGADRYAYLTTVSAVPYAGYAVAYLLLRGNGPPDEPAAPAWDASKRKMQRSTRYSKQQLKISNASRSYRGKSYWWTIWILLSGTMLSISTSILSHWRNEDSLFEYSLRTDPSDWKIYGQRAEYLLRVGRCGSNNIECRQLWTLAYQFSPRGTLKSELYRLHLLVALGDNNRACDGYFALLKDNAENGSVHNNAAVCLAMRGMLNNAHTHFSQALQCLTPTETMTVHIKNSQEFHEWEAKRTRGNSNEGSSFEGTMTY